MIRCIDVRKVYRQGQNEITALAGITLDITKGEFTVIMGPSGSGKSTLLHLIGGLDRPTSGDVLVDQRLISQMADHQVTPVKRTRSRETACHGDRKFFLRDGSVEKDGC